MTDKILCVDDDPQIIEGCRRGLRKKFRIDTALGPEAALEAIGSRGPYAVVISDMRMPGMDGIQLLSRIRELAPDSVRMMLTGYADQGTTIEAVNEGNVFRFLTKPCPPETLTKALHDGITQYRLVTAEKELLGKTLRGSIKVLTDVLGLVNPVAFGRASRVRRVVCDLAAALEADDSWQIEIAAMLSQIGCVTLPPDTIEKVYHGVDLSEDQAKMFESHPAVGRDLVANIPRLERVAEIIACQENRFDDSTALPDGRTGKNIPLGSRILKVALDFDTFESQGLPKPAAFAHLQARSSWYDPDVLLALQGVIGVEDPFGVCEVAVRDLTTDMILDEDVRTDSGLLLVAKGQEVGPALRQRLSNFAKKGHVQGPIRVLVRKSNAALPPAEARRKEEVVT